MFTITDFGNLWLHDKTYILVLMIYIIVVSAHQKKPDIHIFYDGQEQELALIENYKTHKASWNILLINKDQFNEGGDITYQLQNWHWVRNKWINRARIFTRKSENYSEGVVTFSQERKEFAGGRFDIAVLAINKHTKNLNILYTSTLFSFMPSFIKANRSAAVIQYCSRWLKNTTTVLSSNLISCPCDVQSVRGDSDFKIDDTCPSLKPKLKCHENVGAEKCFIKQIKETYVFIIKHVNFVLYH